jgi:two-component system, NarL family, nitrate/nitrite response regulator NarL
MRLLIADDHPLVLNGLEGLLTLAGHFVVARVRAGDDALREIDHLKPEAAILDVNMPGATGIQIARILHKRENPTPIILLMGTLDDAVLVEAMKIGVKGLVLKESPPEMLLRCIDIVGGGGSWHDREAMARALAAMSRNDSEGLTRRETEIVRMIGTGKRNREIALELGMSEGTVKAHLRNVFEKLGVSNRAELALRARDLRLT